MNRIILIGNGFDKAHGLPTGYVDFINNYWEHFVDELEHCNSRVYEDDDKLCSFTLLYDDIINSRIKTWEDFMLSSSVLQHSTALEKIEYIKHANDYCEVQKTSFLNEIDKAVETRNWVDIENEYYRLLKNIPKKTNIDKKTHLNALNNELDYVKKRLVQYLKTIPSVQVDERIKQIIYEPFKIKDISVSCLYAFHQFLKARLDSDIRQGNSVLKNYGDMQTKDILNDAIAYVNRLKPCGSPNPNSGRYRIGPNSPDFDKHLSNIEHGEPVPDYFLLPDQILLLNFNYTKTANQYLNQGTTFEINHIHGEIDNDDNPIIFGYGDELDESYKELSRLNDNDYLKNMKSIRYLETDNYRNLLRFVDSAPFQIYILGHSCGTSDRTLLNTLFEHKNCVSIKPYYFIDKYGKDNYIELVQNISRNFENTATMRDRVVNKGYCDYFVRYDLLDD